MSIAPVSVVFYTKITTKNLYLLKSLTLCSSNSLLLINIPVATEALFNIIYFIKGKHSGYKDAVEKRDLPFLKVPAGRRTNSSDYESCQGSPIIS